MSVSSVYTWLFFQFVSSFTFALSVASFFFFTHFIIHKWYNFCFGSFWVIGCQWLTHLLNRVLLITLKHALNLPLILPALLWTTASTQLLSGVILYIISGFNLGTVDIALFLSSEKAFLISSTIGCFIASVSFLHSFIMFFFFLSLFFFGFRTDLYGHVTVFILCFSFDSIFNNKNNSFWRSGTSTSFISFSFFSCFNMTFLEHVYMRPEVNSNDIF